MSNEIIYCPECDSDVEADSPEFNGDGTMFRVIECSSCDWDAVEEWVLDATVEDAH